MDVAARVDNMAPNVKLRCTDPALDPGGGGVNVSRALRFLGGSSNAFIATGGAMGHLLAELLDIEGINPITFETPGSTRQSFSVTETSGGDQYRYVLPGPVWTDELVTRAREHIRRIVTPDTLVVASGSLPPGVPSAFYRDLNTDISTTGAQMILDTSGAALDASIHNDIPYFVLRMDGEEAEHLAGHSFHTPHALAEFARSLVEKNVSDQIILALGAEGSVGVSAHEMFFCKPPTVKPDSKIGAGDSLVAAATLALAQGRSFREAVTYGTAAAASAVTTPASRLCDKLATDSYARQVVVTDL